MDYTEPMLEVIQSDTFRLWFSALKDRQTKAIISARIRRVSLGNFGDVRPVDGPVSELRIDHGPGYRLYFMRSGAVIIVLLAGGTKRTQAADIQRAIKVSMDWKG